MYWSELSQQAALFFLIFARIFALLAVAPLLSSSNIPGMVRVGLTLLTSALVLPWISADELMNINLPGSSLALADTGLAYVFLLMGEAFIGILQGFFLQIINAAFQTAGQLFSTQMGFGASQVFDPLAQEEVPLMGQFFNLIAMLVFLLIGGFQKLFFTGILVSFRSVRAADLVRARETFFPVFIHGLGVLFEQAISMAFPIFGTLFLVSITMGLLAKAAPQMNLLMLGFPLAIIVAFVMLALVIPGLMNAFSGILENAFSGLENLFLQLHGGSV